MRQSSDKASRLAAKFLARKDEDWTFVDPEDIKTLAASVLAQDETKGRRMKPATKKEKQKAVEETRAEAQKLGQMLVDKRTTSQRENSTNANWVDPDLDALELRYKRAVQAYEEALADAGMGIVEPEDDAA